MNSINLLPHSPPPPIYLSFDLRLPSPLPLPLWLKIYPCRVLYPTPPHYTPLNTAVFLSRYLLSFYLYL